jgi:hypothetical protein
MENSLKQQTGSCPLKTFDEDKATGSSGRGVSNKRGSFLKSSFVAVPERVGR